MLPSPPEYEELLVRSDYSDAETWNTFCGDFDLHTDFDWMLHSDECLAGLSVAEMIGLLPLDFDGCALFIADATTFASDDCTLLVAGLWEHAGKTFRVQIDFVDEVVGMTKFRNDRFSLFLDYLDDHGVYRGNMDSLAGM